MTTAIGTVLCHLRRASLGADDANVGDGELLERFVARRDEAAFAALVLRHGPMVLAVCRQVLQNQADAEDAFQATFLVLVKKAGSIRPRGMVGNWLYGVAHTTALKARAMNTKRRVRERASPGRHCGSHAAGGEDVHAVLHQELHGLPDRYRAVIVLCDLEGKSQKEAAGALGCPLGTIGTRLARGRRLLARRLTARGVGGAAGAMAALLMQSTTAAGVPPLLLRSTLQAAALFAAVPAMLGAISAPVAALTKGVIETMLLAKLKIGLLLLVFMAALGLGAASIGWTADRQTVPAPPAPPLAPPGTAQGKAAGDAKGVDDEPINHIWITNRRVQQELQLTEAQVNKITAIRLEANRKYAAERKEAEAEAMKLNFARGQEVGRKIQDAERKAFAEAAPQILSAGALQRLRQIQRQARGLQNVILELAVRRKLKLDDEQARQIESLLKEGKRALQKEFAKRATGGGPGGLLVEDSVAAQQAAYAGAMKKVVEVLTPQQQRIWHDLVGEPFAFKTAAAK
jgi:RNA polymerase sigma factor (sigma-70 family)